LVSFSFLVEPIDHPWWNTLHLFQLSLSSLKTLRPDTANHCVTPFSLSPFSVCASNLTFCCSCPAVWAYLFLSTLFLAPPVDVCTFKWWTDASTKETPTPTKGQRNQTDARHIIPNFFFGFRQKKKRTTPLLVTRKIKQLPAEKKKKKPISFWGATV
jgi:hypothetical protein